MLGCVSNEWLCDFMCLQTKDQCEPVDVRALVRPMCNLAYIHSDIQSIRIRSLSDVLLIVSLDGSPSGAPLHLNPRACISTRRSKMLNMARRLPCQQQGTCTSSGQAFFPALTADKEAPALPRGCTSPAGMGWRSEVASRQSCCTCTRRQQ